MIKQQKLANEINKTEVKLNFPHFDYRFIDNFGSFSKLPVAGKLLEIFVAICMPHVCNMAICDSFQPDFHILMFHSNR